MNSSAAWITRHGLRVSTTLYTVFHSQHYVSFRFVCVCVAVFSLLPFLFLRSPLSLTHFVCLMCHVCSFVMRPFFGECFPSKPCTICLMTKWQLNVSRVDSVVSVSIVQVGTVAALFTFCLDSHILPGLWPYLILLLLFIVINWVCVFEWILTIEWYQVMISVRRMLSKNIIINFNNKLLFIVQKFMKKNHSLNMLSKMMEKKHKKPHEKIFIYIENLSLGVSRLKKNQLKH